VYVRIEAEVTFVSNARKHELEIDILHKMEENHAMEKLARKKSARRLKLAMLISIAIGMVHLPLVEEIVHQTTGLKKGVIVEMVTVVGQDIRKNAAKLNGISRVRSMF